MKLLGAALGGLALMSATAVSSQAEPANFQPANGGLVAAADNIPCWTSFNPPAPQGGPMIHYYKNCNTAPVTVATGFVDAAGQATFYHWTCTTVPVGATWHWAYEGSTRPGVNYQTVICLS
ncbi:hypothetical protein [Lentzea miocenica]|nr:hypothetical protein [Lentzea sp. BCCO 10_0856]